MSIINKIKELEKYRSELLKSIVRTELMVRGKFGEATRKCGKQNCHCVSGKGHPYRRIYWSENNRHYTKNISKNDVSWTKSMTESYRDFRKSRQQLRAINEELRKLLDQFENEIISKTNQLKDYL